MRRIFEGIKNYISDWKNWLTHTIIGVFLLIIALFAPVDIHVRISFLAGVVAFNTVRMKYFGS